MLVFVSSRIPTDKIRSINDSLVAPTHVRACTRPTLSRIFLCSAGCLVWRPRHVDVRNADTLWVFLAMRRDLTSLTHTLRVPAWPSSQSRAYLIPCVLARMDNLRSLTLPSFDLRILRYHSAFGLRYIEFGNASLSGHNEFCEFLIKPGYYGQAEGELLTWLDGQTSVVPHR